MGQDLPRSGYDDPPVDFTGPISDAALYPRTSPLHTYHLGLWFNSPTDAQKRQPPKRADAVQWRAQYWHSGLEHVELP